MLPTTLESIRRRLNLLSGSLTEVQKKLLEELNEVDKALAGDEVKSINEGLEKRGGRTAGGNELWGSGPNGCNICGRR